MKRTERRQKIREVVIPMVNELMLKREQPGQTVEDTRLIGHDTVIIVKLQDAI